MTTGRASLRRARGEAGSGPVSLAMGVAVLLGFLLLATQVLVHLTTTSTITAAAFDGARRGAVEDADGCPSAVARSRAVLGSYGQRADVEVVCHDTDDVVSVTVRGPSPARALVRTPGTAAALEHIERTATVQREAW